MHFQTVFRKDGLNFRILGYNKIPVTARELQLCLIPVHCEAVIPKLCLVMPLRQSH